MKKKKVIITSIIATLLLAGLLFYWNNNEVHACEAVSLEEAREILTEENLLLEYHCRKDCFSISFEFTRQVKEDIALVICRDGSVYYCSSFVPSEACSMSDDEWSELTEYSDVNVVYLGKISTYETICYRLLSLSSGEYEIISEEYRREVESEPQGYLENDSSEARESNRDTRYFEYHQNSEVQAFLDWTLHECNMLRLCDGELEEQLIHFQSDYTRGVSDESKMFRVGENLHNSYFFEQYATMALIEMYTGRNPILNENTGFVYEGDIITECIVLSSDSRAEAIVSYEDKVVYSVDNQIIAASWEDLQAGREPLILGEVYTNDFIVFKDMLLCYFSGYREGLSRDEILKIEENETSTFLEDYCVHMMQSDGEYLYCTNAASLIRLDCEGDATLLWEGAVYAFTVDAEYIYIFDGNTWEVLEKETGEDLGYIATDINFAYETDEVYATEGNLYFIAWNRENESVSCNRMDMEGNLTQIGESHIGIEACTGMTASYGQYLFYSVSGNIVRVNVNTGEEDFTNIAECGNCIQDGIYRLNGISIVNDYLMVSVCNSRNQNYLLGFNPDTLVLEEEIHLE